MASSYTSTLSFDSSLNGADRSYNGDNIKISMTAYTTGCCNVYSDFTIKLYRNHWYGDDYIGKASVPRNGYSSTPWSNVGSGTYHFRFEKALDGAWVKSDKVVMANY